jgi:TPR repeat protein
MYFAGRGVAKDYTQAAQWWQKAANQGHSRAQTHLALMLSQGLGLEKDANSAKRWLAEAEKQGHPPPRTWLEHVTAEGKQVVAKKSTHFGDF